MDSVSDDVIESSDFRSSVKSCLLIFCLLLDSNIKVWDIRLRLLDQIFFIVTLCTLCCSLNDVALLGICQVVNRCFSSFPSGKKC